MLHARSLLLLTIFAVLVACAGIDPTGSPNEAPGGLRELTWGAPPDAGLRTQPVTDASGIAVYLPHEDKRTKRFLGVPVADEAYTFAGERFFSGSLWVDGKDNYVQVLKALEKRYGAPARTAGHYDRDTLADENKSLAIWHWAASPVEVRLSFSEKLGRATITYFNRDVLAANRKQHGGNGASDAANPESPQPDKGPEAVEPAGQPASHGAAARDAPASAVAR